MLESEYIVGIDLVRIEQDEGIYGIYESVDGGEQWKPLIESQKICDLLDYAKARFPETTPLVMPQHIQNILKFQIMEEAAEARRRKPTVRENWLKRIFKSLFKRE